jgi:hypothetical protein
MPALFRVRYRGDEPYVLVPATMDKDSAKVLACTELERGTPDDYKVEEVASNHAVGHRFKGPLGSTYRCTSYDSRWGFWMENEEDPDDRRNVSERAPGRTFHRIYSMATE